MVQHEARTPGLLSPGGNPLSRKNSVVSQLSSEQVSSVGTNESEPPDEARAGTGRSGGAGEELKCVKCGNNTFKATTSSEGQRLKCKRCGTVVWGPERKGPELHVLIYALLLLKRTSRYDVPYSIGLAAHAMVLLDIYIDEHEMTMLHRRFIFVEY
jgi:ribosomal protein S27AE